MSFNSPSSSGTDYRICSVCGFDYNARAQPRGHKCELRQLQEAAILAYDSNQMDKYDELNRMIAAKILGSRTSKNKAKSSADNGRLGGRPKEKNNDTR